MKLKLKEDPTWSVYEKNSKIVSASLAVYIKVFRIYSYSSFILTPPPSEGNFFRNDKQLRLAILILNLQLVMDERSKQERGNQHG